MLVFKCVCGALLLNACKCCACCCGTPTRLAPALPACPPAQRASVTLDAGVKIYSYRVDSVHTEMFKILGGLGRASGPADEPERAPRGLWLDCWASTGEQHAVCCAVEAAMLCTPHVHAASAGKAADRSSCPTPMHSRRAGRWRHRRRRGGPQAAAAHTRAEPRGAAEGGFGVRFAEQPVSVAASATCKLRQTDRMCCWLGTSSCCCTSVPCHAQACLPSSCIPLLCRRPPWSPAWRR